MAPAALPGAVSATPRPPPAPRPRGIPAKRLPRTCWRQELCHPDERASEPPSPPRPGPGLPAGKSLVKKLQEETSNPIGHAVLSTRPEPIGLPLRKSTNRHGGARQEPPAPDPGRAQGGPPQVLVGCKELRNGLSSAPEMDTAQGPASHGLCCSQDASRMPSKRTRHPFALLCQTQ